MKIVNFKLKISILLATCYLLFATVPAFAQSQNPHLNPNTNPDVPKNLHTWTQNVMIEVMSAMSCQLSGIDTTNPKTQCLGVDQKTGKIGFVNGGGGAIGVAGKMIAMLYTPPLHTGDYFKYLANNFGIAKSAHAATGFQGLRPIQSVWVAFRDIVYLLFVIIFIVIGLAIMLRVRIDPRTVMTIQNQIPKIIVGIILVTFSYAISGFLIDMMYTSIYLTGNLLTNASSQPASVVTGLIQSDNPFSAAKQAAGVADPAWQSSQTVAKYISPFFDNTPGRIITGILGYQLLRFIEQSGPVKNALEKVKIGAKTLGSILGTGLGTIVAPGVGTIIGGVVGKTVGELIAGGIGAGIGVAFGPFIIQQLFSIIAFLIIMIAVLWALFRLWFILILSYIYILIDVTLAPFWIAGGLIPGSPVTFTGWLRHIASSLLVFPLTIGLFLLGKIFIDAFGEVQTANQFVPPLIGNPASTNAIGAIIGLGIILLTPNVLTMAQKALKAPQLDVGSAMRAIGAGAAFPINVGKTIGGTFGGAGEIVCKIREEENTTGVHVEFQNLCLADSLDNLPILNPI